MLAVIFPSQARIVPNQTKSSHSYRLEVGVSVKVSVSSQRRRTPRSRTWTWSRTSCRRSVLVRIQPWRSWATSVGSRDSRWWLL